MPDGIQRELRRVSGATSRQQPHRLPAGHPTDIDQAARLVRFRVVERRLLPALREDEAAGRADAERLPLAAGRERLAVVVRAWEARARERVVLRAEVVGVVLMLRSLDLARVRGDFALLLLLPLLLDTRSFTLRTARRVSLMTSLPARFARRAVDPLADFVLLARLSRVAICVTPLTALRIARFALLVALLAMIFLLLGGVVLGVP